MSEYSVSYHAKASVLQVGDAAEIMYQQYPYPRMHFPWPEYLDRAIAEAADHPCIVCTCNGRMVGALTVGGVGDDLHFPGKGMIVYNTVVDVRHPKVTMLLYRFLVERLKAVGAEWYQTTKRVSETEFHAKFRRVHG